MAKVVEKKADKTSKRTMTPAEKMRQEVRSRSNKERRLKQRARWLLKRQARMRETNGLSAGASVLRNARWRSAGDANEIRKVQMLGSGVEVVRRPSVGLAKVRAGFPTRWVVRAAWQAAPPKEATS